MSRELPKAVVSATYRDILRVGPRFCATQGLARNYPIFPNPSL